MAQQGVNREIISCSICLDLLKDPVTTSCGHSYCMNCIERHWDGEKWKKIYSCPQCRQTFKQRPVLQKNTMLADLVEQLKKTGLQAAPAIHCFDGSEGHDTVSAAAERAERQRELEGRRQNIQQRIQDREKHIKVLQQEVENIIHSADEAVEDSEKMLTELIHLMEKICSDVKQQVRSKQQTEVSRVLELQEKLEQEITELKRKDAELEKLSHTEDHYYFLYKYRSVSALSEATHSSSIKIRPLRHFEDVIAAVTEARDDLQEVLTETWTNISQTVMRVNNLLPQPEPIPEPEPKTRAEFLKYSRKIRLDPNTANTWLLLSEWNRKVTNMDEDQSYPDHPDRFTNWVQVLSRQSLTGRCYWEVESSGLGGVGVAVAYKNISRAGRSDECGFGRNDKSWSLYYDPTNQYFQHNKIQTPVSGPRSLRVGVYLDHHAGILSFYSVSKTFKTMTLLHRVQTTFTQPLYAGLCVYDSLYLVSLKATAEFIKLK